MTLDGLPANASLRRAACGANPFGPLVGQVMSGSSKTKERFDRLELTFAAPNLRPTTRRVTSGDPARLSGDIRPLLTQPPWVGRSRVGASANVGRRVAHGCGTS